MTLELTATTYQPSRAEKRFVGWHLVVAIASLGVGSFFGPLQALEASGIDLYPYLQPLFKSYYQGLTLHGVLNALVWTTFFITSADVQHGLKIQGTNVNLQVVPGHVSTLAATFDQPGTYPFICTEFCGLGHAGMFGQVIVEEAT